MNKKHHPGHSWGLSQSNKDGRHGHKPEVRVKQIPPKHGFCRFLIPLLTLLPCVQDDGNTMAAKTSQKLDVSA